MYTSEEPNISRSKLIRIYMIEKVIDEERRKNNMVGHFFFCYNHLKVLNLNDFPIFHKFNPFWGYLHVNSFTIKLFLILSLKMKWTNLNKSGLKKTYRLVLILESYKILLLFRVKLTMLSIL